MASAPPPGRASEGASGPGTTLAMALAEPRARPTSTPKASTMSAVGSPRFHSASAMIPRATAAMSTLAGTCAPKERNTSSRPSRTSPEVDILNAALIRRRPTAAWMPRTTGRVNRREMGSMRPVAARVRSSAAISSAPAEITSAPSP